MTHDEFVQGMDIPTYVSHLGNYRSFVRDLMGQAVAAREHVSTLKAAVAGFPPPVFASIMTEDWCGDSACNLAVLTSLLEGAGIELRVFRGSENAAIEKRYHDEGADHIPVVSIWDGSGSEIGRWIEAPAAVTERRDAWKAQNPDFVVLYKERTNDKAAAQKFAVRYREFLEVMVGWYRDGMWNETTREISELL